VATGRFLTGNFPAAAGPVDFWDDPGRHDLNDAGRRVRITPFVQGLPPAERPPDGTGIKKQEGGISDPALQRVSKD
jgi:hypothetical protein